jgi:hypothetical protein
MEQDDSIYAPQSPSYAPQSPGPYQGEYEEPHPQHRLYRGSVSHITPFTPTPTETRLPPQSFPTQGTQQQTQYHQFQPQFNNNPFTNTHQSPYQQPPPSMKQEEDYGEEEDYTPENKSRAVSRSKKMKTEAGGEDVVNNAPGVAEGIEVRTKFPVARIKRIMQADEDVGKVAQVTPVAVCKSLFSHTVRFAS